MPLNIAIDGPVGAGKSTIAKAVADKLNILHLDTGAMYRALGLTAAKGKMDLDDGEAMVRLMEKTKITVRYEAGCQHTYVNGQDASTEIRQPQISMAASRVSRHPGVRDRMVALQQSLAANQDMVLDGRDIGTRVLPGAAVKIFLTAAPEERARRRYLELRKKGGRDAYEDVLEDLLKRDEQDQNRPVDPLRAAADAVTVDTTELTFDESVEKILSIVAREAQKGGKQ